MNRSKKLTILLVILLSACLLTFFITKMEIKKEQIKESGEVILSVPTDTVTQVDWELRDANLQFSFHKEDDWVYDEDEHFPVDPEKMQQLLTPFADLHADLAIDDVEDIALYGLDDPAATIHMATETEEYTITLGDYSKMDQQRYLSLGDGKVYLVQRDPMDEFNISLDKLILNDSIPALDDAVEIRFTGTQNYTVSQKQQGQSYRENDTWFTEQDDGLKPLNPEKVEGLLEEISAMVPQSYVTYNATEEELVKYGMDHPELTIEVDYAPVTTSEETAEDIPEDAPETAETFTLHISRDPEELAETKEDAPEDVDEVADESSITAYVRVGDSPIIYRIYGGLYNKLIACGYDDLRHEQILPAEFDTVSAISFSLGGQQYDFTSEETAEGIVWYYGDREISIYDIERDINGLKALEFTDQPHEEALELAFTATLKLEGDPTVRIELYRWDGSHCLAVVDGKTVALVDRWQTISLVESVNSIILAQTDSV